MQIRQSSHHYCFHNASFGPRSEHPETRTQRYWKPSLFKAARLTASTTAKAVRVAAHHQRNERLNNRPSTTAIGTPRQQRHRMSHRRWSLSPAMTASKLRRRRTSAHFIGICSTDVPPYQRRELSATEGRSGRRPPVGLSKPIEILSFCVEGNLKPVPFSG